MKTAPFQSIIARLGASLLLMSMVVPVSAAVESPDSFVRRVFARYRNHDGPGVVMARPDGAAFYAASFLDAVEKDSAVDGEGSIDWDPLCDCQDYEHLRVKGVAIAKGEGDQVMARVAFTNFGRNQSIILKLSQTPAGWRIADVVDHNQQSVMDLLKKADAQPSPAAHPSGADPTPPKP